jgi:hypothetical protein
MATHAKGRIRSAKVYSERSRINDLVTQLVRAAHAAGRLSVLSFGMPAQRDADYKLKLAEAELRRDLGFQNGAEND